MTSLVSRPPFWSVLAFAFVAALAVTALGSDRDSPSVAAPAAASSAPLREVAALPQLRIRRNRARRERPAPAHRPATAGVRKRVRAVVTAAPRARPVVTAAPRPSAGVQAPVTAAPPAARTPTRFDSAGGFDSSG